MGTTGVADFVEALRQSQLLEPAQWHELSRFTAGAVPDSRTLAAQLLHRGWLTPFQVNEIFRGHSQQLVLGPYILLERLGQGAMGQVFKARHQRLHRLVALKVIRREVTGRADAVRRFLREIQAIAQLNHPNIVLALDAGEVDGRLFFAMEYVEGIDLARLVERSGPVGVGPALEYVRQVALGLQHASERGLVHRDIKPSNLLLSERVVSDDWFQGQPSSTAYNSLLPNHQVKILDMGLARLQFPDQVGVDASSITQVGMVVGTPDFLAPEQAADSRQADIRSDLYSLGCTLYYLLTGTVPFPGGTLMDKLFRHRLELARPVERLRPEVPSRVGWMVRKLMAKCPEERYQTPLELARAVETLLRDGGWSLPARERGRVAAAGPAAEQAAPAPTEGLFTFTPPGAIVALLVSNSGHGTKERRRQAWIVGVVGLLALGWIVLGAILWLFIGGR